MDIVQEVLQKQKKDLEKYKPITVEKHLEVTVDVGHLMATDPNYFDDDLFKKDQEQYLMDLTRDNTQLLINAVWELPTEREEEAVVAKMHVRRQFYPVPETPCAEAAHKIEKKKNGKAKGIK
uniref:Ribosome biogenesis regulatory protein n=1 Tax=Culex pipiens TaxID=7175 RepID=A0A8D8C572_CULPI